MVTCKNCDFTFEGKFCPNCGQSANIHRFTLTHFGHDSLHAITHTDKGMFFLMKEMTLRPGKVFHEYVAGKRRKYFSPLTYLLIITALSIFIAKKTHIYDAYTTQISQTAQGVMDSDKAKKAVEEQMTKAKEDMQKINDNSKILNLVLIPLLGLLTWLFFKKSQFNYAENLVLTTLTLAQTYVFFLVIAVIPFLLFPGAVLWIMLVSTILSIIYSIIVYKQVFGQRTGITIFKGIVIQLLYMICVQQLSTLFVKYL